MKNKFSIIILSFIMIIGLAIPTFADEQPSLTKEQSTKISAQCGAIRQSLKDLQRSDSRARTYFGAIYETISSKFLKPLNLRLVNNDISDPVLLEQQTSLATMRSNFSDDFIQYSKALEELIAIDCRSDQTAFYKKLIDTRDKRSAVAEDVRNLNALLTRVVKSVETLKGTLK